MNQPQRKDSGVILRLPYPDGPKSKDSLPEARRKIAENLAAISKWARERAADLEAHESETDDRLPGLAGGLSDGAAEIDRFAEVIR